MLRLSILRFLFPVLCLETGKAGLDLAYRVVCLQSFLNWHETKCWLISPKFH